MRRETRVIAVAALLASSFFFLRVWAYDDVSITAAGTNAPFTAENPLVCNNFTYTAQSSLHLNSLASFTSGTHWIYGTLETTGNCTKYSSLVDLLLTGAETVVNANSVKLQSPQTYVPAYVKVADKPLRTLVRIENGAKLVVSNSVTVTPSTAYNPTLSLNNGTIEILKGELKFDRADNSTSYFYSVNSTVSCTNGVLRIGHTDGYGGVGPQIVRCTNTTFNVKGLNFQSGLADAEFVNCRFPSEKAIAFNLDACCYTATPLLPNLLFKDCSFDHLNAESLGYPGSAKRLPHVTFDGGRVSFDALAVAYGQGAHLTITNGTQVALGNSTKLEVGNSVTGILDIAGSRLLVTNTLNLGGVTVRHVSASNPSTGGGYLNLYDGAYLTTFRTAAGINYGEGCGDIVLGVNESAVVNVYGGVLAARGITLASNLYSSYDLSAGTYEFHQTGGVVTNCLGDSSGGTVVAAHKKSHATLELNGGRYVTVQILGGAGESTLLANGGTVVRGNRFQNVLMNGLTHAKVGPKGLTLETPSRIVVNVTTSINQAFENMEGGEGEIRKTGDGVLKITTPDADWNVTRTVAREGTLMIANDTRTLGGTEVVTTNSGILSAQGDGFSDGLTVKGLALSGGAIALDNGEVVTVTNSFRATAATAIQFATTTALGAEVKAIVLAKGVTLSTETLKALALPSATGRTTAKGRPLVGKLFVKPGANDTQEIWYTVIKQPSGFAMVVK